MRIASAVEPGAVPTSLLLLGSGDDGWGAVHGEVVLPVTPRNLQQRQNGLFGGVSVRVAVLVAVAAVTAVYLVLRCAVYLANANKSRAALRHLAGTEENTDKEGGEPCRDSDENRPTAAAPDSPGEESGALDKQDLLKRVRRYTVELVRFVENSEPLVRQLSTHLRIKCIAALLSLSLVETSALFSLLEGRERGGIDADIYAIGRKIWSLRNSIGKGKVSRSRERHIKYLHTILDRVIEVNPAASSFAERQRMLRIDQLLQLQEIALAQVNAGLFWLRESLKRSNEADTDAADEGAAAVAGGAAAASEDAATPTGVDDLAVESAAAAAVGADAAADGAFAEAEGGAATPAAPEAAVAPKTELVVEAILETMYKRREHVLNDPVLSGWLRMMQPKNHYGLINRTRIEEISQKPLLNHAELLEDLYSSTLGLGYPAFEHISAEEVDRQQETASSVREAASRGDRVSPQDDPDPRARVASKHPSQHSQTGAGAEGSSPASASPSISTPTAGVPAAQTQQPALEVPGHGSSVLRHKAPSVPQQVASPAFPGRLQVSAMSAAPGPADIPSYRARAPQVTWASKVSAATSAKKIQQTPPSPKLLPKTSLTFFRAAVSSAAAYAPEALTLRPPAAAIQAPVSSAPHSASVATPVKPGLLPASTTAHLPAAASRSLKAGIDRSASSSRHRHGSPSPSGPQLHKFSSRSPASARGTGAWPLQTRGGAEGSFPRTGNFVSTSSASLLQRPTSQPLPPSPWIPAKYRSALGIANPEGSQDIDTWPFSSPVWSPPVRAPPRPPPGFSPIEGPDGRSDTDAAAGHAQLAELFREPGEGKGRVLMQPRQVPPAEATPQADAADPLSPTLPRSGEESW